VIAEAAAARYTVNCSMLFTELPVLQRPQAVRDAGFEAIEFVTQFEDLCDVCVGCGYQGKQRAVADGCQANGNRANARGMKVNRGTMALLKPAVRVGVAPALHNGSQSFEVARSLLARTKHALKLLAPPGSDYVREVFV
jgi:hypothetical protein